MSFLLAHDNTLTILPIRASDKSPIAEIDHVMEILQSLKRTIEKKLVDLAAKHNMLIPINKLPAELTVEILHNARLWSTGHYLSSLCAVQVHWWHLINTTPSFWTYIGLYGTSSSWIKHKLQCSGSAPLTIDCGLPSLSNHLQWFLPAVNMHISRWRSFRFVGKNIANHLGQTFKSETPSLQSISLHERFQQSSIQFAGSPHLQHIHFEKILPTGWGAFRNLISFGIEDAVVEASFNITILGILDACPALSEFTLASIVPPNAEALTIPPPLSISLPHLTSMKLNDIPLSTILTILNNLQASTLTHFQVSNDDFEGAHQVLAKLVDTPSSGQSQLSQIFATAGVTLVRLGNQGHQLYLEAGIELTDPMIIISLIIPITILQNLLHLVPFAGSAYQHQLEVSCGFQLQLDHGVDSLSMVDVLTIFPNMTRLELEGVTENAMSAISYLSEVQEECWPCQRLEEIQLVTCFIRSVLYHGTWHTVRTKIARMLEARQVANLKVSFPPYQLPSLINFGAENHNLWSK